MSVGPAISEMHHLKKKKKKSLMNMLYKITKNTIWNVNAGILLFNKTWLYCAVMGFKWQPSRLHEDAEMQTEK